MCGEHPYMRKQERAAAATGQVGMVAQPGNTAAVGRSLKPMSVPLM